MADSDNLKNNVKHAVFYLFALAFHGIAITVFAGIIVEATQKHTNWVDGCYRGGNGVFAIRKDDGSTGWYNYFSGDPTGTPSDTAPADCNSEATAELYIVLISLSFVVLDTLLTAIYWIMGLMEYFKNGEVPWGAGEAFKTWSDKDAAWSFGMWCKGVRASGIFGAYLAAFVWACGFTASFNSRPVLGVDFQHDINPAFEASSFLISFMISILVTILPVQGKGSGYSMLWS